MAALYHIAAPQIHVPEEPIIHTNNQTTAAHSVNGEAAFANNEAQKKLQVDKYKILKKANVGSGLSMDHIPSFASLKTAEEQRLGRSLSAVEERTLHQNSLTLAISTKLHQTTSETYGGRNTPARQNADSQNPIRAIRSNVNVLRPELLKDGYTNKEIDKAIETPLAPFIKK